MKSRLINLALVCGSVLITILAVLAFDRLIGVFLPDIELSAGLIFAPGAEATYESHEFTYTATINNLGFRDYDVPLESDRALRVVVLGDSFTFGMGVAIEDTWVKLVEENLRAQGRDIEILNLGRPGSHPNAYAIVAARAIPILKPDVVLVGLLQMNDIRQTWADSDHRLLSGNKVESPPLLPRLFPNISALVLREHGRTLEKRQGAFHTLVDIGKRWRRQSRKILREMTDEQQARFERIDRDVQNAFRNGRINPSTMPYILSCKYATAAMDLDKESGLLFREIRMTSKALEKIKTLADAQGATVIGLSIPTAVYTDPSTWETRASLGFPLVYTDFATEVPDEAARLACKHAGFECVVVTEDFRVRTLEEPLYYPVDTHFNAAGNRVYADLLTPILAEILPGS